MTDLLLIWTDVWSGFVRRCRLFRICAANGLGRLGFGGLEKSVDFGARWQLLEARWQLLWAG
jgi:hypothetical protein